jgi:hypothetical protein
MCVIHSSQSERTAVRSDQGAALSGHWSYCRMPAAAAVRICNGLMTLFSNQELEIESAYLPER